MKTNKPNKAKPIITEELVQDMIEKKILTKERLHVTDAHMQKIYSKAKRLYESGNYKEAINLFSLLHILEEKNPTFLYGLGSCHMLLNDYDLAVRAFLQYSKYVPHDPTALFYIATCYEKLNDLPSILITLQATLDVAGDRPQYKDLKQKATLALDYFKKQMEEQLAEKTEAK